MNTDYNCALKNQSEASQKMKRKESSFYHLGGGEGAVSPPSPPGAVAGL